MKQRCIKQNIKPSIHKIGLLISVIVSILINSHQIMILFFNAPPMPGKLGDILYSLQTQTIDLVINLSYFFITAFIIYELNFYVLKKYKGWVSFVVRFAFSFLLAMLLSKIMIYTYSELGSLSKQMIWGIEAHYGSRSGIISILMIGISQIIYLYRRNEEQRVEVERLLAENMRSQYIALKNQINPHFLFNSLNTLNGLISIDIANAQLYVQRLSDIFRYSMQDKELVTIAQEVEFAQTFGELMKIRYGNALTFKYDISEEIMNQNIIPFSLQILIENAVKHNVISQKKPLTISVFSNINNNRILVENPIQAKREHDIGEGIGLANLTKRYELIGHSQISITQNNNIFSVSLPIIEAS